MYLMMARRATRVRNRRASVKIGRAHLVVPVNVSAMPPCPVSATPLLDPKSEILITPSSVTRQFAGFMSLWTIALL